MLFFSLSAFVGVVTIVLPIIYGDDDDDDDDGCDLIGERRSDMFRSSGRRNCVNDLTTEEEGKVFDEDGEIGTLLGEGEK